MYHSHFSRGPNQPPGINNIFPLIPDKVNKLQTQGHYLTLNINSTRNLNPAQTSIDVSDRQYMRLLKSFSIAIRISWKNIAE